MKVSHEGNKCIQIKAATCFEGGAVLRFKTIKESSRMNKSGMQKSTQILHFFFYRATCNTSYCLHFSGFKAL